jgi:hypothetical protein
LESGRKHTLQPKRPQHDRAAFPCHPSVFFRDLGLKNAFIRARKKFGVCFANAFFFLISLGAFAKLRKASY